MKCFPTFTTVAAALLGTAIGVCAPAFGHSGETHPQSEYQPVDTEFGSFDPGLEPDRVIVVRMSDAMRFDPERIDVAAGEVIRFEVHNDGELLHEFVLGTESSLETHAEMMKKFPNMEHDEPYMAHVSPGDSREITWRFDVDSSVAFGCLLPGHFDAGMKGVVQIER